MTSSGLKWWFEITDRQRYLVENRSDTVIITVPAGGLVPSGAGPSTDTVMAKSASVHLRHRHLTHWGRDRIAAIFQTTFSDANIWNAINISLSFVPKGLIDNIPALVLIMAWRRSGDKPLSEPMMVSLLTHICVIRPQWVKQYKGVTSWISTFKSTQNGRHFSRRHFQMHFLEW